MKRTQMFMRILLRSTLVRPRRSITALFAITVASGVATAMLTLYSGVQTNLHRQFRSYGANILLTAVSGTALPDDALVLVERIISPEAVAAPFGFVVARTEAGDPVVVAGVDFERTRKLNTWWAVTAWARVPETALIGARVAGLQHGQPFDLTYGKQTIHLRSAGELHTGGDDDRRLYISLNDLTRWTGVQPNIIEIAATGDSQQLNALMARLAAAVPQAEVRPVRQIVEAEGRVFEKTRSTLLAGVTVIILTSMLCVLATLTASLLERRKDFALMKALGAGQVMTNAIFGLEAASLGLVGGIIGYGIGIGLAELISWRTFQDSVPIQLLAAPGILLSCVGLTLLAALLPLALMKQVQPANMLKGE